MRVLLSAKAVWAAAKDVDVAEKVRTASIMVRKSRRFIRCHVMVGLARRFVSAT